MVKLNFFKNFEFISIFCFVIAAQFHVIFSKEIPKTCKTPRCLRSAANLKESMDFTINPCDDFYQYSCGNWGKKHPPKTEFTASSVLQDRTETNSNEILEFLQRNNSDEEPRAVHKARKLFSLCINTDALDKKGIQPVKDILNQIGISLEPNPKFDMTKAFVKMHKLLGKDLIFKVEVSSDPYDQTINRISILRPTEENSSPIPALRARRLIETLSKSEYENLALATLSNNDTSTREFSLSTNDNVQRVNDYFNSLSTVTSAPSEISTVVTVDYLQNLTNTIADQMNTTALNWTRVIELVFEDIDCFNLTNESDTGNLKIITEINYLTTAIKFIHAIPPNEHETGMVWNVLDTLALYTGFELRNLKENYTSDIQNETREIWCANSVSQILGMAVSYFYATDADYQATKTEVYEMVEHIHTALKITLKEASWMDADTKDKALNKTDSMKMLVAFPDSIRTKEDLDSYYKDLHITDDFLESVILNVRREVVNNLNTLNTTNNLNKDRRHYTPVEVNAFYDTERNTIIIPAGILGFPIYGNGIKALNYGAIGSIVGHEITHGFDNQGRRFNYLGNLENWWEEHSLNEFKKRAICFEKKYSNYTANFEGIEIWTDSTLTLSENIADNGGFKEALLSYREYLSKNEEPLLPYFETFTNEQLFTLGFAHVWCEQPTILSAILAPFQNHSPNPIRVNGVAINSEEFSKIWNCTKGSKMNPITEKCHLW